MTKHLTNVLMKYSSNMCTLAAKKNIPKSNLIFKDPCLWICGFTYPMIFYGIYSFTPRKYLKN